MSIINSILPKSGMSMTISDYIIAVTNLPQMRNDRYARIKAKKTNLGRMLALQEQFATIPSVIIDDEADEITPGAPRSKKTGKAGKTHDKIAEIFKVLRCCTYLSVTATPQANLLLSIYDDMSPDFVTLVRPGTGYCGGNEFHDIIGNSHVITIKDSDDFQNNSIPTSFVDAFHDFVFSCCLKDDGSPYSMLIHPSRLNEVQNQVANAIQFYFQQTCSNMVSPGSFAYQASIEEVSRAAQRYEERTGNQRILIKAERISVFIFLGMVLWLRSCEKH